MEAKWTKGPLTVRIDGRFPYSILTHNAAGEVVFRDDMPCHSSRDMSITDVLDCVHFDSKDRAECAAANHRALADAHLRAAAPDMAEALARLIPADIAERPNDYGPEWHQAAAALAKASGGQNG